MKILVTGCAGFIGHHVCNKLIELGYNVIGIDNLNKYYDPILKTNRLKETYKIQKSHKGTFKFIKSDICDREKTKNIFSKSKFNKVIHLAAQAGVRYSLENPYAYFHSNLSGFGNIIQLTKDFKIPHFVYASSSSVYGLSKTIPFSEKSSDCNRPLQIYAASKRSNELMAHAYSHLFQLKTTGLRFFTVYGPWGRPDMALFKFTENIIKNKKIEVFNYGRNVRDFTYIDDIVDGVIKTLNSKKQSKVFEIINLGNEKPINIMKYISLLEKVLKKKSKKTFLKEQPGDMKVTYSDNSKARKLFNYTTKTRIDKGINNFVDWYLKYFYK